VVRNFVENPDARVMAVCDVDPQAFARVKGIIPSGCEFFTDPDKVLKNSHIDAVAIVTPATTHAALAEQALKDDKHVLCEKPLAFDGESVLALADLARSQNKTLMVGYTFLFNRGIEKMKEYVDTGCLGSVYYVTATRTHLGLVREDVDAIWDLASHDVAIINHLLDEIPNQVSVISASPLKSERVDVAFLGLSYSSGIIANIHVSWVAPTKMRQLQVVGSKARTLFNDLDQLEPVKLFNKGIGIAEQIEPDFNAFRYLINDGDIISPKLEMEEPLKIEIESFFGLIRGQSNTKVTSEFVAGVSRTLAAASQSLENGGAPQNV
jgi:predicted dehydrogenase